MQKRTATATARTTAGSRSCSLVNAGVMRGDWKTMPCGKPKKPGAQATGSGLGK